MKVNELKQGMDASFEALDARITDSQAETRRHFDIVAERLRDDIALLADGLASMSTTLERSLTERGTVIAALDDHEVRIGALERRRHS